MSDDGGDSNSGGMGSPGSTGSLGGYSGGMGGFGGFGGGGSFGGGTADSSGYSGGFGGGPTGTSGGSGGANSFSFGQAAVNTDPNTAVGTVRNGFAADDPTVANILGKIIGAISPLGFSPQQRWNGMGWQQGFTGGIGSALGSIASLSGVPGGQALGRIADAGMGTGFGFQPGYSYGPGGMGTLGGGTSSAVNGNGQIYPMGPGGAQGGSFGQGLLGQQGSGGSNLLGHIGANFGAQFVPGPGGGAMPASPGPVKIAPPNVQPPGGLLGQIDRARFMQGGDGGSFG